MVDLTPPVSGWVVDGLSPGEDLQYSSDSASVRLMFGGFSDPESDIKDYQLSVYRKHNGEFYRNIFLPLNYHR